MGATEADLGLLQHPKELWVAAIDPPLDYNKDSPRNSYLDKQCCFTY